MNKFDMLYQKKANVHHYTNIIREYEEEGLGVFQEARDRLEAVIERYKELEDREVARMQGIEEEDKEEEEEDEDRGEEDRVFDFWPRGW